MLRVLFQPAYGGYRLGFFGQSQQHRLHTKVLNSVPISENNTVQVIGLKNDREAGENKSEYLFRSQHDFIDSLRKNSLHIYVDKAHGSPLFYPGHIFSFITDPTGRIIPKSEANSRPDINKMRATQLVYRPVGAERDETNAVWEVAFLGIDAELKRYLFEKAVEGLPVDRDRRRFLLQIPAENLPSGVDEIITRIQAMKMNDQGKDFVLHSGYLISRTKGYKIAEAFNCINPVYGQFNVVGHESNPSPQMALWSLLAYIFDIATRDKIIDGTGIRVEGVERTYDDPLHVLKQH